MSETEQPTRWLQKRTKQEKERDLVFIAELFLRGLHHQAIRDRLIAQYYTKDGEPTISLAVSAISHDMAILINRWRHSEISDMNAKKGTELAKIDNLEAEYWKSWELSKIDAVTTMHEDGLGAHGNFNKDATKVEGRAPGNPSFLQGIQWCIDKRCQILGLNAPDIFNINAKITQTTIVLSDSERAARILNILERAQQRREFQTVDVQSLPAGTNTETAMVDRASGDTELAVPDEEVSEDLQGPNAQGNVTEKTVGGNGHGA